MKLWAALPAVMLAQCAPTQSCAPVPAPLPYTAAAVGDSVLWQARDALKARVQGVYVDGYWGRGPDQNVSGDGPTLRTVVPEVARRVQPGGWLVVQEAGDHEVTVEFVDWVVMQVPDTVCLAWVTNDYEVDISAQPCSTVIDWGSAQLPEDLEADGLHLSPAGIDHYADLITRELVAGTV